jgi:manganese/iron transport system permease protein
VLIGLLAPVVGLYVSYWADAASGATIVLVETALFLLGLAWQQLPRRRAAATAESAR